MTVTIGSRIRDERSRVGLNQEQLAAKVDMNQSAISRIESGDRQVATHELFDLAEALGVTTGVLLGVNDRTPALTLAGRLDEHAAPDVRPAVARVQQILESADLLSRLFGDDSAVAAPRVDPVSSRSFIAQGAAMARDAREVLGLGAVAPVADLPALLEEELDVHVAVEVLPDTVSGMCAAIPGACVVLVNAAHTPGRQRWTLAHEMAHLLFADLTEVLEVTRDGGEKSYSEKRADAFAAHFLLPDEAVKAAIGGGCVTPALVGSIAHRYGMSLESVSWRLVNCKLINRDERASLVARGRQGIARDGDLIDELGRDRAVAPRPPRRLTARVVNAYVDRAVGAGIVADVLGLDDVGEVDPYLANVLRVTSRKRVDVAALA